MQRECVKCNKIVEVANIERFSDHDIRHLSCGHSYKKVSREIVEVIPMSDSLSWTIIKDPINELTRAEKDGDYYKLFSYACTVSEY